MNPLVDDFLDQTKKWKKELTHLRAIVLDCGLTEELKWKQPCYTFEGKNIVIVSGFKEYCALNFFKGALISDSHQLLIQPTENMHSARQIRFTNLQEIIDLAPILKTYIYEAIEVEKAGLKVTTPKKGDVVFVEELQNKLNKDATFKRAFESLTPGRQRGYNLFFAGAKQAKTREDRIEKYTDRILKGFGYQDCVCGLSQRMPSCDGSHKQLK